MKKEWIYFMAGAGAGLIAAAIFFAMPKYADKEECILQEAAKLNSQAKTYRGDVYAYCDRYDNY